MDHAMAICTYQCEVGYPRSGFVAKRRYGNCMVTFNKTSSTLTERLEEIKATDFTREAPMLAKCHLLPTIYKSAISFPELVQTNNKTTFWCIDLVNFVKLDGA